ncbi:hypothetical protein JVT61DRAFT_692 [Boletus reticuloceps]|uniref:Peptide hydrolase n=1 Tax=Boletus reticuloceps TaxID=495285 RepID=A0A8I3AGW9_9AGAM|nr:hypothetical protein JVT61DRAFT_692 [Boletus reticuloceps]
MSIRDCLRSIFAFNTIPTTILLVFVYAAIFSAVLVTDNLPPVPRDARGLDLDQAWWDLHQVSARPHPFNSHANDLVRDFILERLGNVAERYPHIAIDYDVVSNASWASGTLSTHPRAIYQEGNNILVKIQGTDPAFQESGGYLLSAHYDSVSTAPGTTDDSMGIVTLLQMVEYFAKNRPKRVVVFNFNNNEESGLNGAHAFLEHPWADISDVFLNLEGAAAGGRPAMFRATNIAPLFSWTSNHVPHPHANVIFADSFSRGVIRSATDYSVYEEAGLNGLDFAFYKGRSRYHTWYDSIPGMEGGKKALWAMMEATHGASLALANDDAVHAQPLPRQERPVYFELFGAALVVFSLEAMFITNVVLLSTGPILLLLLAYSKHIVRLSRRIRSGYSAQPNGSGVQENLANGERILATLKTCGAGFWCSTKFWVALAISIGLQAALIAGYVNLNPFILHSQPFLVFASALSLAYLSTVLVVSFPCNVCGTVLAPEQQKLSVLLQLYVFTWVLLVFSTVVLRSAEIGGTYFITAWNLCALLGCIAALAEATTNACGFEEAEDGSETYIGPARYQAISTEEDGDGQQSSHRIVEDPEPTETTPLVPREHSRIQSSDEGQGAIGWWILQFLLVVPLPVILVFHISITLLGAMNQTLTDGNSPASTYGAVSLLALLLVLPMSPFSINAHRWLTLLILAVFVLSTVYTWVAFPFSQQSPLKIYFVQSVNLSTSGTGIEHATTALTGPKYFLARHIIPELPSAFGNSVACRDALDKVGLHTCTWEVEPEMAPSPGGKGTAWDGDMPWVSHHQNRTGSNSAQITVQGLNTRFCTLSFTNRRISKFTVAGDGDQGLQKGYDIPALGLSEIQLWSRDFGNQFVVSVEWKDEDVLEGELDDGLKGRVSCGWDEYERATVGGGRSGGKIPSLEEVIQFLPEWAVVSKSTPALFSAEIAFEV